jgi:threonine dehydrogenase-like Zn-dependent dehydrogenase
MKALVLAPPRPLEARDVPQPARDKECLVRVTAAGICGTDLQLLEGYADFRGIPGHEFVGIVEAAPPEAAHWIGKRVVGDINVGCGACEWCRTGVKEHCLARSVVGIRGRDGAFAEFLSLPAANLHAVPPGLDDESAVFVEPVAAACRILEQVELHAGSRVAVLGDGRMGLLVSQTIRTVAPDVTVIGKHDDKLAVARQVGLRTRHADERMPSDTRFDVVVDATGRGSGLERALQLVRPRGIVVLKSTFHGEAAVAPWPIVVNEVTIVGSRCGPFDRAIDLLARGAVAVKPLVSRVAALDEYQSAFADARRMLKVLLVPGGSGIKP